MKEKTCPECGCPIDKEQFCPECGCPIEATTAQVSNDATSSSDNSSVSDSDYNEGEEPYTPFSSTPWFFQPPVLLAKYPTRGDFAKAHLFWGWLFNPWHVSYRGNGNKDAFDTLNNFFFLCNLIAKTFWYAFKYMTKI